MQKNQPHNPDLLAQANKEPAASYVGCADEEDELAPDFTILIFGGGGDLSRKKLLPTLYHLFIHAYLPKRFSIVCAGSPKDTNTAAFREIVRQSLKEHAPKEYEETSFNDFASHIHFMFLRFETTEAFAELKTMVETNAPRNPDGSIRILYFLSVPPLAFQTIIGQIGNFGMSSGLYNSRVIIEKPFGTNLESSMELNAALKNVFTEEQIYRIDHYLGKETVQNIMFFRFSNSMFEPLWNNKHIDNIQITIAEDIGIDSRGKFYETSGVIRDIIQNHALQLLSLVAMEPPVSFEADSIRDEKAKVCKSIAMMSPEEILQNTVIGQYGPGQVNEKSAIAYREESFVATDSITPTFFAGKFAINNWRWSGVPFYVRAGKRLGKRMTDIVIQFKRAPYQLFGQCQNREPGTLTLSIQPEEAITMRYEVKYPNTVKRVWPVAMTFSYDQAFHVQSMPAYARLIYDSLKDDLSLFVRQDGIEAMWRIADPLIAAWTKPAKLTFPNYSAGSSGPAAADELLAKDGKRWLADLT